MLKLIAKKSVEGVPREKENAPKNGMQRCVKVERKRDAGQKMLKRFAKKSVDSVGENPLEGIKTTIQNLNIIQQELQQESQLQRKNAEKNVLEIHVEDKRIEENVLKGLLSAKKPVGERKKQRRKNPKEGGKEEKYLIDMSNKTWNILKVEYVFF